MKLEELEQFITYIDNALKDLAKDRKGGPGSGCHGDTCGRKPSTGKPDNERINVSEGKPVRISEGGQTSAPPKVSEITPRPIKEIKEDLERARAELQEAEQVLKDKPDNQAARNQVGHARQRVREVEREGRNAIQHARKPKKSSNTTDKVKIHRHEGESTEDCVARGISTLVKEGYSQDQATAMAYKMCSEKGICDRG